MGEKIQIKHYRTKSTAIHTSDNIEDWIAYWRANPHRFIKEYIGGELYDFQEVVLYGMDKEPYTVYAAGRGVAKTSVGAWFAIERAILYPKQRIGVTAFEKSQGVEFIKRIESYSKIYPNLAKEIKDIKTGVNNAGVWFKNGSFIGVKTNSEGSRSVRFEIIIVDEFALFKDRNIIKNVFGNTLTNLRKPDFLKTAAYKKISVEERKKYQQPNKEVYLSSIRTEGEWSWQYFLQCIDFVANGDDRYFPIAVPYHYGVKNGYITEEVVAKQFREGTTLADYQITRAEYEAIPIRMDSSAFFQYQNFSKIRTSTDVLISMSNEEYIQYKDKPNKWKYYKEKRISKSNPQYNEIRFMSIDIALIGGSENDNTCIDIFRCQPTAKGYKKILAYSETMNGRHHKLQALRIKQLFYEMECDFLIIDAAGNSVSVAESLMEYTEDPYRGITYDPWKIANPDEVKMNTLKTTEAIALPIMYAIKTGAADNHMIYLNAKSALESEDLELPVSENEAQSYFETQYDYYKIPDDNLKQRLMNTFVQTSMLVIEATNLVSSTVGVNLKLEPKSGKRKDRFTAWVYGLWLVKRFEDMYKSSLIDQSSNLLEQYTLFV